MKYIIWYTELILSVLGFSAIMLIIGSLLYGMFCLIVIVLGAIAEAMEDDHENRTR